MSTEAIAAEKPKRNYNALFGLTLLALLVLLWVILSLSTSSFASANNISNLLRQGSMIAILASNRIGNPRGIPGTPATARIIETMARVSSAHEDREPLSQNEDTIRSRVRCVDHYSG